MADLLTSSRRDTVSDLRAEYERTFSERMVCLKNFYEMKHETLLQTIKSVYKKIAEDEVLVTMKKDMASAEFVTERVKEVFEEVVSNEREIMIERLGYQLTEVKSECNRIEGENMKLRVMLQGLNQQLMAEKSSTDGLTRRLQEEAQTRRSEVNSELTERERELKELKYTVKQLEKQSDMLRTSMKEKDQEIRAANHRAAESQSDNQQLAKRINDLQNELQDLESAKVDEGRQRQMIQQQTRKTTAVLEDRLHEMQQNSKQMQQALRRHYKQKSALYKKKIEEYKTRLNEIAGLRSQTDRQQMVLARTVSDLEHRIATIMQQNDRKMVDYKNTRDKEKMELEKKHDWQLKEFQSHYEELLERKVQQVEEEASYHIQNMIEQEKQFKIFMETKIQEYEAAYVRRSQHQDLQSEKQIQLQRIKYQLEEKEQKVKEMTSKISEYETQRNKIERDMDQARQIIEEHDHVVTEMKIRRKELEEALDTMSNMDKKNKRTIQQLEEKIKAFTLQLDDKSRKLAKAATKIANQENQLKDLEFKCVTTKQQLQDKDNKIKEQLNELRTTEKANIDLQTQIVQLNSQIEAVRKQQSKKSETVRKDFDEKIAFEKQQTNQYKYSEQISKEIIAKLTAKCQEDAKRGQQLSEKIVRLEWTITNQKQKQKEQEQQIKTKIEEFTDKEKEFRHMAENFEVQLKNKDEQIQELQQSLTQEEMRCQRKAIALQKFVARLKGFASSLKSMMKEITSVKDYITSMKKLQVSQFTLWISTLQRELEDTIRSKHIELISQEKKTAEQVRDERLATEGRLKTEFNQTLTNNLQTIEQLKQTVRNMKAENQSLNKSLDINKGHITELNQKLSLSQKRVFELNAQLSTSQQKYKSALLRLLSDFKQEKESMVKQIEAKDRSYQEDFIQLHKLLKALKSQSQMFKENFEVSKNKINKDLQQALEREKLLQRQLKQKTDHKQTLEQKLATISKGNSSLIDQLTHLKESQKTKNSEILKLQSDITEHEHTISTLKVQIAKLQEAKAAAQKETSSQKTELQLVKEKNKRLDQQILQMHSIVGRTVRNADNQNIRMAKILDSQTKQLTNKVKELKKISTYLSSKDGSSSALRS